MKFLEFVDKNNEISAFVSFWVFIFLIVSTVMFYSSREDNRKSQERMNLIKNGYHEVPTTYVSGTHWEKK